MGRMLRWVGGCRFLGLVFCCFACFAVGRVGVGGGFNGRFWASQTWTVIYHNGAGWQE